MRRLRIPIYGYKYLRVAILIMATSLFVVSTVHATSFGHILGFTTLNYNGTYFGSYAELETPNTSVPSGYWTAMLTGVTNWTYANGLIEAGAIKRASGTPHPYCSYQKQDGSVWGTERTDLNLGGGLYYNYRAYYINSDIWEAYFISGGGTYLICSARLGHSTGFYLTASGGESGDSPVAIGPATTRNNKWYNGIGTWSNWCYSWTYVNVGSISSCNSSNYSWSVQYTP